MDGIISPVQTMDDKESELMETANREPASNEIICQQAAAKLAAGLITYYQPKLQETNQKLFELTARQKGLINEMQEENRKLSEAQCAEAIQEMFNKLKLYQVKLAGIKKEITYISEKSGKLKKRALKLQQSKEKEALQRKSQREKQLQREQELIAKPSTSTSKKS